MLVQTASAKPPTEQTMPPPCECNSTVSSTNHHVGAEAGPAEPLSVETPSKQSSKPVYDAFFVSDDNQFTDLAWHLLNNAPQHCAVIQSPEDFDHGHLIREVKIDTNGFPQTLDGLLFSDTPVTLLIDFRNFPPERIPELNELFETPPRIDGRILGSNVRIVSVISPAMLPTAGQQNAAQATGPDFWWRINSTCPPRQASDQISDIAVEGQKEGQAKTGFLQTWLNQHVPKLTNSSGPANSKTNENIVDFTGQNWRSVLFGMPDINEDGRIIHRPGALEGLQAGQSLVLKNAPWQDLAFTVELAQVLRSGTFHSNGQDIALPENLTLFRQPLSREEKQAMADSIQWQTAVSVKQPALINEDNFALIMHEHVLTQSGEICRRDMLEQWLKDRDAIRVTSPLREDQWLQLVRRLQKANLTHLPVLTDVPEMQPYLFRRGSAAQPMSFPTGEGGMTGVTIEWGDGHRQLPLSATEAVEEFVILPEQSLTKIAQRSDIVSLQRRRFHCSLSRLAECLKNGTPVCLSGLQSNPVLLRQLETLLCSPPSLILFGERVTLTDMRLTITWPKNRPLPSPVWQAFADLNPGKAASQKSNPVGEKTPVDDLLSVEQKAFQAFSRLYDTMHRLQLATYCPAHPPSDLMETFGKIVAQAESERDMDGYPSLHPFHFYQAVSSVILKEYRPNQEVYSYLKQLSARLFLPEEKQRWVDKAPLQEWVARHQIIVRKDVKNNFWSLARAFPATMFPDQQNPEGQTIDKLTALLIIVAADGDAKKRELLEKFAGLSPGVLGKAEQELGGLQERSLRREETFYNRLVCLDKHERQPGCLRQQAQDLAAAEHSGEEALKNAIDGVLSDATANSELQETLCAKEHDWSSWEQRRIKRLAAKVRLNPVVCIKGATGAGKSYIAEMVARTLNPAQAPRIITVGPETELSDLLGRPVLKASGDDDHCTECQTAPLTQWAKQESCDGKPVVLIIDEANLAIPELWNCLKGLYEPSPCLYLHGERMPVSASHRIIMTGNPDHFSGRRTNELLRIKAPQLYYTPLAPEFIREKVLRTGLTEVMEKFSAANGDQDHTVQHLLDAIELLYTQYQNLLPERVFTPRDLTDLVSRIEEILAFHEGGAVRLTETLTEKTLNGLVWQAFDDALGGEISEEKQAEKKSLKAWYSSRKPCDSSLIKAREEAFENYYQQWLLEKGKQASPGVRLDYTNDSTRLLMNRIWLEQQRGQHEKQNQTVHRGRHATVIAGPAGRGKSALLARQLTAMCQQAGQPLPEQINAGHSSWSLLQQAVSQAKQRGYPLIVSELNLLKSEEVEGLLNNAITGQAAPGFHLYTTVNPASFIGRHRFSPALKNRFTCLSLADYTDKDIGTIGKALLPASLSPAQHEQIIEWHLGLRFRLKRDEIPLQPSIADLQRFSQVVEEQYSGTPFTDEQLGAIFMQQYNLFLTAGKCRPGYLPARSLRGLYDDIDDAAAADKAVESVTLTLNSKQLDLNRPVTVKADIDFYDVTIKPRSVNHVDIPVLSAESFDQTLALENTQLALASLDWENKSRSLAPPYSHDTLYSACYQKWRATFMKRLYGVELDLEELLSAEERETLNYPGNEKVLCRLKKLDLFDKDPSPRGLELLWEELHRLGKTVANKDIQPQTKTVALRHVDGNTKHRHRRYTVDQVFKDIQPRDTRINTMELAIEDDRVSVSKQPINRQGCNIIIPTRLEPPVYLQKTEHYGVVKKTLSKGMFSPLPGIYAHQTITSLSTTPEVPLEALDVIQDRGTGKLFIRLADTFSEASKKLEIHYVVRQLDTYPDLSKKMPATAEVLDNPFTKLVPDQCLKSFNQTTYKDFITALKEWGAEFEEDENIEASSEADTLSQIISRQKGCCRHIAWGIYAIAAARGVVVRLVKSDTHMWVELSPDRGGTWVKIEADRKGPGDTTVVTTPEFQQSAKGVILGDGDQARLLELAKSDPVKFAKLTGCSQDVVYQWISSNGETPLEAGDLYHIFTKCRYEGRCRYEGKGRNPIQDLQMQYSLLKSGSIVLEDIKHICAPSLARDCGRVLGDCFLSKENITTIVDIVCGLRCFFEAKNNKSASQHWFEHCWRHADPLCLNRRLESYPGHFERGNAYRNAFILWRTGVLDRNLLEGLSVENVAAAYECITRVRGELYEWQRTIDLPDIMAKLNEYFKYYYPAFKAPAAECIQPTPAAEHETAGLDGKSPSLEQRLVTTSIGTGYSWHPEGDLVPERLLKKKAPFKEQKACQGTRAVKLIQGKNGVLSGEVKKINERLLEGNKFFNRLWEIIKPPEDPGSHEYDKLFRMYCKIEVCVETFAHEPNESNMNKLKNAIEGQGITITADISDMLTKRVEKQARIKPMLDKLPHSFAGYLERKSLAATDNLGIYRMAEDKKRRGYQLLTSKEAIHEADSVEEPFIHVPESLFKEHLQEEDSESLFITSDELTTIVTEYCSSVQPGDL
ncbi:ATP-binding protein [Sansalvadorimonas sp. 2012CJ34-2]|uniref:ATP-binding protein n=1 Tax=Parendozoicomonas callyspongiae TaxID=2942213 RepID=A0ABT0PE51_9GAMM|nr:ATP-binding protein [Sansalvadorimonas sp. 2012CJ34-2]MCL6269657.1 ATP-binding protein [Sansalvadorimonas sp. 2012CJ34-2]